MQKSEIKPIPVTEVLSNKNHPAHEEISNLIKQLESGEVHMCGCMGPQGNDPYCPCDMRNMGLQPTGYTQKQIHEHNKFMESLIQTVNNK